MYSSDVITFVVLLYWNLITLVPFILVSFFFSAISELPLLVVKYCATLNLFQAVSWTGFQDHPCVGQPTHVG